MFHNATQCIGTFKVLRCPWWRNKLFHHKQFPMKILARGNDTLPSPSSTYPTSLAIRVSMHLCSKAIFDRQWTWSLWKCESHYKYYQNNEHRSAILCSRIYFYNSPTHVLFYKGSSIKSVNGLLLLITSKCCRSRMNVSIGYLTIWQQPYIVMGTKE